MRDLELEKPVLDTRETSNKLSKEAYGQPSTDNIFNSISSGVKPKFKYAVEQAWQDLPKTDKNVLRTAGVKISLEGSINNKALSTGMYLPNIKQILIGQEVKSSFPSINATSNNDDPQGVLKHEVGHALFHIKQLDNWKEFNDIYNKEANKMPHNILDTAAFTGPNGKSETFAELYAAAQGRRTTRTIMLKHVFPELSELIENTFSRSR